MILLINLILTALTHVSSRITAVDAVIFRSTLKLSQPDHDLSFDEQIALIRKAQVLILGQAPVGVPIPDYQSREPIDLIRNQSGLCYDRSRTYDKLFTWLGMPARHLYILYLKDDKTGLQLSPWQAMLTKGTATHAVTEVKTKKGWMLVDSNSPWIALTRDGEPVDGRGLLAHADQFGDMPDYFKMPFISVPGMYSRRGQFYRPYIPYPVLDGVAGHHRPALAGPRCR